MEHLIIVLYLFFPRVINLISFKSIKVCLVALTYLMFTTNGMRVDNLLCG